MQWTRFEILLPLFFNDGRRVDVDTFLTTDEELINEFGATSNDRTVVHGRWTYGSITYSDQLARVRVDAEDTPANWENMRRIKEVLKVRFEQIEIWITAHRIELV